MWPVYCLTRHKLTQTSPTQILRALVSALDIPVSCKIRLLPTQEDTIALVKRIAQTGISNLTVHCRTKDMRPREPALTDRLSDIVNVMKETGIPVVANGDCLGYLDADRVRHLTGAFFRFLSTCHKFCR